MSKKIVCPNILRVVNLAIKKGGWTIEDGTKHPKLRHQESGRMVAIACNKGDPRGHLNLEKHIKHVERGMPGWGMGNVVSG